MNKLLSRVSILLFALFMGVSANGETYTVDSYSSYNSAYSSAVENDVIEWEPGVYSNVMMVIHKSNITVKAKVLGETIFTGSSRVHITGDNVKIEGFQFIGGDIGSNNVINTTGSYNLFTQLNIKDYTCYKYLVINEECQYNTVSYCNFENRINYADQNILSVLVDEENPGYNTIKNCSFKNFSGYGSSVGGDYGVEAIRIGVSSQSEYISKTIVEYCYFTECNGDGEIISNKSKQNTFRYNTFENNKYSELVLRHGDEGIVYGNFFLDGMGGVRIREGQGHVIFNNYFSGLTARSIYLQNDSSDPLDDILIAYNTIVDCGSVLLGGSGSYKPTNVVFANNIFTQPKSSLFYNETGTETWLGNIAYGSFGIDIPSSGVSVTDPLLEENSEGYFGLASNSPAIDASVSGYPAISDYEGMEIDNQILLDLMEQSRPEDISLKDVGSCEYPHNVAIQPIANADNTGPSYLAEKVVFTLDVAIVGNGSVELNPESDLYLAGTEVSISAIPDENNLFDSWSGDISGSTNPAIIVIDDNKSVTANFISDNTSSIDENEVNSISPILLSANPVIDEVLITINQASEAVVKLELFDISGVKVKTLLNKTLPIGEFTLKQNISDILSGAYILRYSSSNFNSKGEITKTVKLIKK